jgi:FKBP-type peptidyl-prolyl cis-trans isomerase 2
MAEKKEKNVKRIFTVNYIGKELLNNTVFDTNIEKIAKENFVYNEKKEYKPLIVINGEKELLHVVEDEIQKMKEGEEKRIIIAPSHAFGERSNELIRVVPIKTFKDQKINPVPGLVIALGENLAKVQSVSGGRVRIDLNHPLAGREIEYYIKIEKEIKEKKEIGEKIFEKYFSKVPNSKYSFKDETAIIQLPKETMKNLETVFQGITKLGEEFNLKIEFKEQSS